METAPQRTAVMGQPYAVAPTEAKETKARF